jgi:hypothetical protein
MPAGAWDYTYYVYDSSPLAVAIGTVEGGTVSIDWLKCDRDHRIKVEKRDATQGRLLSTHEVTARTGSCPAELPTPAPLPTAKVWAYKSFGTPGRVAKLRLRTEASATYWRFVVRVHDKRGTLATLRVPVRSPGSMQFVAWRVPKSLKHTPLRFSVQAVGASSSAKASASLVITK